MKNQKIRLPQKGGAKRAAEIFEKTRKKTPSDELVKIISEIPEIEPEQKPKQDDRAARDREI